MTSLYFLNLCMGLIRPNYSICGLVTDSCRPSRLWTACRQTIRRRRHGWL